MEVAKKYFVCLLACLLVRDRQINAVGIIDSVKISFLILPFFEKIPQGVKADITQPFLHNELSL